MPHARLAPGPRGMMPADDLNRIGRAVQRLRRIPSLRCQANRCDTQRNRYSFVRFGRSCSGMSRTVWWSQTGSNRRPPACKAGALPTELWPRLNPAALTLRFPTLRPPFQAGDLVKDPATREHWWAWKDLNFRPHAYQARALTN